MITLTAFAKQFAFSSQYQLHVGVERESFLARQGQIVPEAPFVLKLLEQPRFGYELSACQLEDRVGPCQIDQLGMWLTDNDRAAKTALDKLGLIREYLEVAPDDMPLDVYPDPSGRYAIITKDMPRDRLLAACRVTGTHIHIGMPDHVTAMRVYNGVIDHTDELCELGDHSSGKRLGIYRVMAPNYLPIRWCDWNHFESYAVEHGFLNDPRSCWHLIRLSVHGTIEFRMFGSPNSNEEVVSWARHCHSLCQAAL